MSDRNQEVGHRRFPRLPLSVPVVGRVAQFGVTELPGTVQNLGGGGLMAEFPVVVSPGSVVALTLQTRHGPLALTGQVAWAGPPGPQVAHGIAFREPRGDAFVRALFQREQSGPAGGAGVGGPGPCPAC